MPLRSGTLWVTRDDTVAKRAPEPRLPPRRRAVAEIAQEMSDIDLICRRGRLANLPASARLHVRREIGPLTLAVRNDTRGYSPGASRSPEGSCFDTILGGGITRADRGRARR